MLFSISQIRQDPEHILKMMGKIASIFLSHYTQRIEVTNTALELKGKFDLMNRVNIQHAYVCCRKELAKFQTPSPSAYPSANSGDEKTKNEVLSIYPKDNSNKFSIGGRRSL